MITLYFDSWEFWVVLTFCLIANGFFAGAELALVRLRFSHFNPDLLAQFERDGRLQKLMKSPDELVQSLRVASVLCNLGVGTLLFLLAQGGFRDLIDKTGVSLSLFATYGLALIVFVPPVYTLSDLFPRSMATRYPLEVVKLGFYPLMFVRTLFRPVVIFGKKGSNLLIAPFLEAFKFRPLARMELESQLELLDDKDVSTAVQSILRNTFQLRDLVVADVLLPRNQVKILNTSLPIDENLKLARETGHTRFPLCNGDLDHCIGLVHVKDLFRHGVGETDLRTVKRDMIRVDGDETLEKALSRLLTHNIHMALVVDEFRGVAGVLTLEKILEQLVGDIRDEFDAEEGDLIREAPSTANTLIVDGLTPLHELEEHFDVDLSNDEVSTVNGLITLEMGYIPKEGESIEVHGLILEVTEVDETRVIEASIRVSDTSKFEKTEVTESETHQD